MDKKQFKKSLERITDISKDGVNGYETAAGKIDDESIKTLFLRLAQQRKAFIEDIKNEALKLGIEFDDSSTIKGFFHRTWLNTKASLSSDKRENIIEEAMTGEKEALKTYTEVLADPNVPAYLKEIIEEQQRLIKVAIQQLNGLFLEK